MNTHTAYLSLGAFYTLLIMIGIVALLMGGGSLVSLFQLGLGALAVVGLWGYTLRRGFFNPRIWRPLAGILAITVVLQLLLVLTTSLPKSDITWMLLSAIFSAILVMILYHYGNRDQALWASQTDVEGGKVLEALLARESPLSAENITEKRKASVTVGREGSHYRARIRRERDATMEQFEECFSHPATLARFLVQYASMSADDIARQNTHAEE